MKKIENGLIVEPKPTEELETCLSRPVIQDRQSYHQYLVSPDGAC